MNRQLIAFSSLLVLAGCSAGMQPETIQEAYLPPADTPVVEELAGPPQVTVEAPASVARLDPPSVEKPKPAPAREQAMICDISVVKTSHGVRITPVVRADRDLSGEYALTITKSGGAGSSDISQGGPFDAARGMKQELGSSEISLERGARFHAVLKVRANGREVCRDVRS